MNSSMCSVRMSESVSSLSVCLFLSVSVSVSVSLPLPPLSALPLPCQGERRVYESLAVNVEILQPLRARVLFPSSKLSSDTEEKSTQVFTELLVWLFSYDHFLSTCLCSITSQPDTLPRPL